MPPGARSRPPPRRWGRVVVRRGFQGTRALAHKSGATFWIGSPEKFKTIQDNAAAIVGDNGTLPDFCIPGVRATDGMGNEYVMVDLAATIYGGATVPISPRRRLYRFRPGIWCAGLGWYPDGAGHLESVGLGPDLRLQRSCPVGGSSLPTSTGVLEAATSVSTPAVGLKAGTTSQGSSVTHAQIYGMHLASAATTATTSATSATGLYAAVWLNYPFVMRQVTS